LAGIGLVLFCFLGHLLWNPSEAPLEAKAQKPFLSIKTLKILWLAILVGSILSATAVISASPQLRYRVASIFAMRNDSSISYRLNVYNSVSKMIQHNPLIGIGPGN